MKRWLWMLTVLVMVAGCTPEEQVHIETQVAQWLTATPDGGGIPPWVVTHTPQPAPPTRASTPTMPVPGTATASPVPPDWTPPAYPPTACSFNPEYLPPPEEFHQQFLVEFHAIFDGSVSIFVSWTHSCLPPYPGNLVIFADINAPTLDQATLQGLDAQLEALMEQIRPWPAPYFVTFIKFLANGSVCEWDSIRKACDSVTPPPLTPTLTVDNSPTVSPVPSPTYMPIPSATRFPVPVIPPESTLTPAAPEVDG